MTTVRIDPEQTLGALTARHPALIATLEQLRIDYCCGGNRTLAEACRSHGLDPATVAVLLERLVDIDPARQTDPHDLRGLTIDEICDHVVHAHHDRLRGELPRIADLLATVVRVHGGEHGDLRDLERLFAALAGELRHHLEVEEAALFPAVRAVACGGRPEGLSELVEQHTREHAAAGDALVALRELTGGYDAEAALCSTHRRLLQALEAFELDLHQHVHEENNLLFPRLAGGETGGRT